MAKQLTDNDSGIDPCAFCGIDDVLEGDDIAAHWDKPGGTVIVAWTCSRACQEALELRRLPSGLLLS